MTIDQDKITQAVLATGCSPLALEEGSELITHWIDANAADVNWKVVAVECGFVNWIDPDTVIIGVQDLLTEESNIVGKCNQCQNTRELINVYTGAIQTCPMCETFVVGNEWKTTGARSESDWYDDLVSGSQLAIYALAAHQGTYYEKATGATFTPRVSEPRIRVRGIKKSTPPVIWPKQEPEIIAFTQDALNITRNAMLVKAAEIRAARRTGVVPWQLPGIWCTNKFRRQCEHWGQCTSQKVPAGFLPFDLNDPAFKLALPHVGERVNDPELVVLGASAYAAYSECAENGRRNTLSGNRQDSLALQVGSVFHVGVAEFYRQIKENQQKTVDSLV